MTMVIDLPQSIESEISAAAAKQGMDAGSFIRAAVEEKLRLLAAMKNDSVRPDDTEECGSNHTASRRQGRTIRPGMFPQLRDITEEDFKRAEWRGEDVRI